MPKKTVKQQSSKKTGKKPQRSKSEGKTKAKVRELTQQKGEKKPNKTNKVNRAGNTSKKSKERSETKSKVIKFQARKKMADQADRYELYQSAVQVSDSDIEFFAKTFKEIRGRQAKVLREDFCGTAKLATSWCLKNKSRKAIGVDIDPEPLAWGQKHHLKANQKRLGGRLKLIEGDVLDIDAEEADIACAMNFSYCVFKTRDTLRKYFDRVRANLNDQGILVLELYGGTEAIVEIEEDRKLRGFTYHWEQESYNPINHHTRCHIHFSFPDGSKLKRAFSYDWRLWTIPEIHELLIEAGFSDVKVYWERVEDGDDDDDDEEWLEGTGEYESVTEVENQESWLVYIVGVQ